MKDQKSRVQCLYRAMDILEALSRHTGVGVTELAAEVRLHVATTHNLLTVLLARNYVLNDRGTYRLGPALAALTSQSDPLLHLARLTQPHLEGITRKTGESAVTSVLSGKHLIMIATTASADGLTCPAVNQVFLSPLKLATGRLLVAYQPAKNWPQYIQAYQRRERSTGRTVREDPDQWKSVLSSVRETGTCFVAYSRDSGAFAVPIVDSHGVVVAALGANSAGRLSDSGYRGRWVKAIQQAGSKVSRLLSHEVGRLPVVGPAGIGRARDRWGQGDRRNTTGAAVCSSEKGDGAC